MESVFLFFCGCGMLDYFFLCAYLLCIVGEKWVFSVLSFWLSVCSIWVKVYWFFFFHGEVYWFFSFLCVWGEWLLLFLFVCGFQLIGYFN